MRKPSRREVLAAGVAGAAAMTVPLTIVKPSSNLGKLKVVAGGPNDFMIVRHLVASGTNEEIGAQLAKVAQATHGTKLGPVDSTLQDRRAWFTQHYPAIVQRAKGAAKHFKQPWDKLEADPFGLGYDLLDQPGCSTVYYPASKTESGHAVLSRNYDFFTRTLAEIVGAPPKPKDRAFTADPYILELHPKNGLASLSILSYDLLCGCIDGVNEKGLTIALLADDSSTGAEPTRGPRVGLGEIEVPRFLLDTCGSVKEAIAAVKDLERYYSFIPCHYIVGDPSGHSAILEWSIPEGKLMVTESKDKPQIVTNHLVANYPKRDKFPEDQWPAGTFKRFCKLDDQIQSAKGKLSTSQIKAFNQAVQAGPHMGPPEWAEDPKPHRTLWHSVYDCDERSLEVSFYLGESKSERFGQRRSEYLKFRL